MDEKVHGMEVLMLTCTINVTRETTLNIENVKREMNDWFPKQYNGLHAAYIRIEDSLTDVSTGSYTFIIRLTRDAVKTYMRNSDGSINPDEYEHDGFNNHSMSVLIDNLEDMLIKKFSIKNTRSICLSDINWDDEDDDLFAFP